LTGDLRGQRLFSHRVELLSLNGVVGDKGALGE
jgi:hypothetical protein